MRLYSTAPLISTHTLRKEGDLGSHHKNGTRNISTHTLRKEGDFPHLNAPHGLYISTHTLRKEGDPSDSGSTRYST